MTTFQTALCLLLLALSTAQAVPTDEAGVRLMPELQGILGPIEVGDWTVAVVVDGEAYEAPSGGEPDTAPVHRPHPSISIH
ncbi:hypothetical protein [Deinococcus multiflagellatus]|uniref:Uncharacterized protein n=1 Tax=Deinococcus multiflagellatus TaxID=1656887 RepID=A0ABW1ZVB2_9DEIO|nr:hypothetical protein [Deinococcus multiflagellatus]MBZ9714449.1 hypothetical protein [Deinococcus multiflagellatus]